MKRVLLVRASTHIAAYLRAFKGPKREQIRRSMGFRRHDVVVTIMSTWGPQSLIERLGERLYDEAADLVRRGARMRFILSANPVAWRPQDGPALAFVLRGWAPLRESQRARGLTVLAPEEEWEEALVATDVVISDHTSLGESSASH